MESLIELTKNHSKNRWKLSLARNYEEMHFLLLYRPDRREDINDVSIFTKKEHIVFISVQGRSYDRFSYPEEYRSYFKDPKHLPEPFDIDDETIYMQDSFWPSIEEAIEDKMELISQYTVVSGSQEGLNILREDTYGFHIRDVLPLDLFHFNSSVIYLIALYYAQEGFCVDPGFNEGYICNNIFDMEDALLEYRTLHDIYTILSPGSIVIQKSTTPQYPSRYMIYPLDSPLKILDIGRLPKQWVDHIPEYIQNEPYLYENEICNMVNILLPKKDMIFTIYVKPYNKVSHIISPIWKLGYIPYRVCASHIQTECWIFEIEIHRTYIGILPPRLSMFRGISKGFYDVNVS